MDPVLPVPDPWRPGRGAAANPGNRFERLRQAWDEDFDPAQDPAPATVFLDDRTRSALVRNDSPDIPFAYGVNPYRGCEHGCSYCYARPYHEYLGMSAGLDFESRILVKRDIAALLAAELAAPAWQPQVVGMSGVTDCYQPAERRFRLTRACLEVFARVRNPVGIITKNALITRDADLLADLARHRAVSVCLSVTSLDQELSLALEPRASVPSARLQAIRTLAEAGVPVGVNIAPVIPGLTDHELPALVAAAAAAGARFASWMHVRLPHGVEPLFEAWLRHHRPTHADKVMDRIRAAHGGRACASAFGTRFTGQGAMAAQIGALFQVAARRHGLDRPWPSLSTAAFMPPQGRQKTLW